MGLGSPAQQSVVSNASGSSFHISEDRLPLIYDQLYKHGYIKKRRFSVWLNDVSASTGSIQFGDTDRSKYYGTLRSVPVALASTGIFAGWDVNLTSLILDNGRSRVPLITDESSVTTNLDTGSNTIFLPLDIVDAIATEMNATTDDDQLYVSCDLRQTQQALEFGFGHSESGNFHIRVPYDRLIYPYGSTWTPPREKHLCYAGIEGTEKAKFVLGQNFLRSAYVVFDADNLEVSMAPARYS